MRIAMLCCDPAVEFGDGHACPARLWGLSRALVRAGHEVTVVCPGAESAGGAAADAPSVRSLRLPVSVREIDWHLSRVQPDLVIECQVSGSLEGVRAAGEAGVPHVYDIGLREAPNGIATSSAVRGTLPEALSLSRAALASSERVAGWLRHLADDDFPIDVVPNGASAEFLATPSPEDVARLERTLRLRPETVRIGFHGPLGSGSGLLTLVRALARVPRESRPRLLVLGDGPERNAALAVAHESGVGLVLAGRVAHRDAPAALALCDVVAVPGEEEGGAPQALLEAMAAKRAVIAPACAAVDAVARHDREALLVAADDVDATEHALLSLMMDAVLRARLGAQARRTILASHTWDARAERITLLAERIAPLERRHASMAEPALSVASEPRSPRVSAG